MEKLNLSSKLSYDHSFLRYFNLKIYPTSGLFAREPIPGPGVTLYQGHQNVKSEPYDGGESRKIFGEIFMGLRPTIKNGPNDHVHPRSQKFEFFKSCQKNMYHSSSDADLHGETKSELGIELRPFLPEIFQFLKILT